MSGHTKSNHMARVHICPYEAANSGSYTRSVRLCRRSTRDPAAKLTRPGSVGDLTASSSRSSSTPRTASSTASRRALVLTSPCCGTLASPVLVLTTTATTPPHPIPQDRWYVLGPRPHPPADCTSSPRPQSARTRMTSTASSPTHHRQHRDLPPHLPLYRAKTERVRVSAER
ncbi:hypothetical protein L226DRAFT_81325 [Lentinus tigrinus ALCF2SS1-7]|uniref:uncharacterized protein n=1 Tax=Lentinus tigrinus ALCF2SS1-7 TaxID=1328758 RepID=UPI0011662938|nr:hypothetical protein L226DRAFT_81325 [Lentinus tigrinus ALCF2SS1-7]